MICVCLFRDRSFSTGRVASSSGPIGGTAVAWRVWDVEGVEDSQSGRDDVPRLCPPVERQRGPDAAATVSVWLWRLELISFAERFHASDRVQHNAPPGERSRSGAMRLRDCLTPSRFGVYIATLHPRSSGR
ncbi:MAG: hypothetical protein C4334_13390 [Pyrinomonas sp.]